MASRKKTLKRNAEVAAIATEDDPEDGVTQPKLPKEVFVIAQEVKIVRALACNDLTKRNRQIRKLRKWFPLRARSSFPLTEDDFMRIWKGLYYNMWMSDKPLVQEELAEQLAQLVDSFSGNTACSLAYFSAFIKTMCQEWFGIDQWRMDKFLMLVRRMLRYMLRFIKQTKWDPELIHTFNTNMQQSVLAEQPKSRGLTMHFMDIFFEELAKAANGEITAAQVNLFIRPFVTYMGTQRDAKLVAQCRTRVLYHLLYQSDLGREYSDKYNAWKQMGFPTASIDDVEKVDSGFDEEDDENNEEDRPTAALDPRAGDVDVHMPELPFNADCVLDELQALLRTHEYNGKRRKGLRKLQQVFETYKAGQFPLGVRTMPKPEGETLSQMIEQKVSQIDEMEEEVYGTGRKLKKLNKAKRKRLLQSINFEEVDEHNYDDVIAKTLPPELHKQVKYNEKVRSSINDAWVVEDVSEVEETKKKSKPKKVKTNDKSKVEVKHIDETTVTKPVQSVKSQAKPQQLEELVGVIPAPAPAPSPANEWIEALKDGESEYFVPSRKQQIKKANSELVVNPLTTPVNNKSTPKAGTPAKQNIKFATPQTGSGVKRVRIMTKCNSAYPKSDYLRQLKLSPQLPYDADRRPGKSVLKPHVLPGPIHPNFKGFKGQQLFNDTL